MARAADRGVLAGHMAAGERALRRSLRAVDVVWEVADARCPRASRNPRLRRLVGGKATLLVLAKADLAEEAATDRWRAALGRAGEACVAVDLRAGRDAGAPGRIVAASRGLLVSAGAARREAEPFRAMAVGLPNVGKSSLINRMAGRRRAPVGARPGVTRGAAWIALDGFELLDLPGILPARVPGGAVLWRLVAIGALTEGQGDVTAAAAELAEWVARRAPRALEVRYGMADERLSGTELLEAIGRVRGALGPGGRVDLARAAAALLADFRRGDLGTVTLEEPEP
jgi:ribosome biogenesis GTPase A